MPLVDRLIDRHGETARRLYWKGLALSAAGDRDAAADVWDRVAIEHAGDPHAGVAAELADAARRATGPGGEVFTGMARAARLVVAAPPDRVAFTLTAAGGSDGDDEATGGTAAEDPRAVYRAAMVWWVDMIARAMGEG